MIIENRVSGAKIETTPEKWAVMKENGFSSRYKVISGENETTPKVPDEVVNFIPTLKKPEGSIAAAEEKQATKKTAKSGKKRTTN